MKLIIIAGMPASGKSTLASKVGAALGYPVFEKDEIKEELFDVIGFNEYPEKRRLDVAANAVLLRCTEFLFKSNTSAILVNNFSTDSQKQLKALLKRYECECITVFLGGDADVFYKRYVERDNLHLRHLGHVLQEHYPPREGDSIDYEMTREEFREKFEKLGMDKLDLQGDRIDIDATYPEKIDVGKLITEIRMLIEGE